MFERTSPHIVVPECPSHMCFSTFYFTTHMKSFGDTLCALLHSPQEKGTLLCTRFLSLRLYSCVSKKRKTQYSRTTRVLSKMARKEVEDPRDLYIQSKNQYQYATIIHSSSSPFTLPRQIPVCHPPTLLIDSKSLMTPSHPLDFKSLITHHLRTISRVIAATTAQGGRLAGREV